MGGFNINVLIWNPGSTWHAPLLKTLLYTSWWQQPPSNPQWGLYGLHLFKDVPQMLDQIGDFGNLKTRWTHWSCSSGFCGAAGGAIDSFRGCSWVCRSIWVGDACQAFTTEYFNKTINALPSSSRWAYCLACYCMYSYHLIKSSVQLSI